MVSEVGSGQVAIFPIFTGFRKAVTAEVTAATGDASQTFRRGFSKASTSAGSSAGKGFSSAFSTATGNANALTLRKLQGDVADATKSMSANLLRVQDAQGRVRVATTALDEATAKWGANSSKTQAAQERLATATRGLSALQATQTTLSQRLRGAQGALATAQSLASTSAIRSASGFGILRGALSDLGGVTRSVLGGLGGGIASAFQGALHVVQSGIQAIQSSVKAVSIGAVTAVATIGFSSFSAASRVQELDIAMQAVAKSTGIAYSTLSATAKAVKAMGIETATGQKLAIQFAQANLDLADAAKIARVAQDLAVISGQNSTDETNQLLDAITSQNTEILRNAGITKSASEGYDAYAASIGATAKDLTDQQKKQAIVNLIISEGTKVAGTYEASLASASKVIRSIPRLLNDIAVNLGGPLLTAFGPAIVSVYDIIKAFDIATSAGGKLAPVVKAIGDQIIILTKPLRDGAAKLATWASSLPAGQPAVDKINGALGGLSGHLAILAPIVGAVVGSLGPLLARLPLIGAAFEGITGPVGLLIGGIAALLATNPDLRRELGLLVKQVVDLFTSVGKNSGFLTQLNSLLTDGSKVIGGALTSAIQQIRPMLPELAQAFFDILNAVLPLIPAILQILPSIIALLPPLVQLAVQLLPILPPIISGIVTAFNILAPVLEFIVGSLQQTIGVISGLIDLLEGNTTIQGFTDKLNSASGAVGDLQRFLYGLTKGFVEFQVGLGRQFAIGVQTIITGIQSVVAFIGSLPAKIVGFLSQVPQQIAFNIGLAIGFLLGLPAKVVAAIAQIPTLIGNVLGGIGALAGKAVDDFVGFFVSLPSRIVGLVTSVIAVFQRIPQGASTVADDVLGFFAALPARILDALQGAGSFLVDVGKNIVQGLIDGITGAVGGAIKAVTSLGDSMLKGIKAGLGIHSPSLRFRYEVGQQIGLGVMRGIEDTQSGVTTAVNKLVTVPAVATTASSAAATTATAAASDGSGNVYIDKIVAPDQNPVVSGRIIAGEFTRKKAG